VTTITDIATTPNENARTEAAPLVEVLAAKDAEPLREPETFVPPSTPFALELGTGVAPELAAAVPLGAGQRSLDANVWQFDDEGIVVVYGIVVTGPLRGWNHVVNWLVAGSVNTPGGAISSESHTVYVPLIAG